MAAFLNLSSSDRLDASTYVRVTLEDASLFFGRVFPAAVQFLFENIARAGILPTTPNTYTAGADIVVFDARVMSSVSGITAAELVRRLDGIDAGVRVRSLARISQASAGSAGAAERDDAKADAVEASAAESPVRGILTGLGVTSGVVLLAGLLLLAAYVRPRV